MNDNLSLRRFRSRKGARALTRLASWALPSLAVASGLGALAEVLRSRFQHGKVFLPERFPNGVWNPTSYGLEVTDTWFPSEDGTLLHGWWVPHPRARGTVLFCHGNSGSLAHQIEILRLFGRLRVNLFAFDYRGYGRSAGSPSEEGLFQDVRAAWDHVVDALGQSPEKTLIFGHSLGGAVAIDGALHRPAAGLIVQASFTDIKTMARALFPQLPLHWVARNQFRSIEKVGRLAMPKLFIHGTEDGSVPVHHGEALYEAAAAPKDLYLVSQAGHNDVHRHGGWTYLVKLSRFIGRALRQRRTLGELVAGRMVAEPFE